eukprot:760340-Hanusia_phi.AAC.3
MRRRCEGEGARWEEGDRNWELGGRLPPEGTAERKREEGGKGQGRERMEDKEYERQESRGREREGGRRKAGLLTCSTTEGELVVGIGIPTTVVC